MSDRYSKLVLVIAGDVRFERGYYIVPYKAAINEGLSLLADEEVSPDEFPFPDLASAASHPEPILLPYLPRCLVDATRLSPERVWIFRGKAVITRGGSNLSEQELALEVANAVLKHERRYQKLSRQLQAFKNLGAAETARRERIPDEVRLFVWQRDHGKCVRCGGSEKLEFDHVIPVAKGGSSTARNIQLLCEKCNREKHASL